MTSLCFVCKFDPQLQSMWLSLKLRWTC